MSIAKYNFNGKVALVTGGGSGIGRSTALYYADNGAKVVVSDYNEKNGNAVVEEINLNGGTSEFVLTDVSKSDDCKKMVDFTIEKFGKLDFACNNAGIGGESNMVADYSIEGWHKVIDTNLNSVFYCMKYQIPVMLKNGGGSIVNMGSILSSVAFATASAYVTAKHAIIGLTQNAAVEYGTQNIRINCIGPAFIRTPLLSDMSEDVLNFLTTKHPIGRLGQPEEIAELVLWLSSEASSFVTGAYYPVDGGYLAV